MLKLSDHDFNKTMTSMLRPLMEKVDTMLEQMSDVKREKY